MSDVLLAVLLLVAVASIVKGVITEVVHWWVWRQDRRSGDD